MGVRLAKLAAIVIGVGMLAWVILASDPAAAIALAMEVGFVGMGAVFGLYLLAFVVDTLSWHMALTEVPLTPTWLYRTWKVRMVGEALNAVLPAGGMGGEPVKAMMLKSGWAVDYRDGAASLILTKTINMLALIVFLAIGFALILASTRFDAAFKSVAGMGLLVFTLATAAFFLVQRFRIASLAGRWLSRSDIGRRVVAILHHIEDMDARLAGFYTRWRGRFVGALLLAFLNWWIGVIEILAITHFLGHPVSHGDAWIIESSAQLVRSAAFLVPSGIGAQEATFMVVVSALSGQPTLGVAVAIVRRARELLWILWGFVLGLGHLRLYGRAPAQGEAARH